MMNTPPEQETTPNGEALGQHVGNENKAIVKAPSHRKLWIKIPLYFFALCGVLFFLLLAYSYVTKSSKVVKVSIDAAQAIDTVMARNYGKYSESHKGWLYVGEGNRTYLMRVVQQAKPQDGPFGDELYFVASGAALDGAPGAIYGMHIVRADEASNDGSLIETSTPYNYDGDIALTPENIRFEALSGKLWGWVLKVQDGLNPDQSDVVVRNKVFAAHGQQIALLATFNSSLQRNPGVSCEEANRRYQAWYDEENSPLQKDGKAASAAAISGKEDNDGDEAEEENEEEFPRCNNAKWVYRTEPVTDDTLVAFVVTGKGMMNGAEFPEQRWKLVFDQKSYSYIVPIELQAP